MATRIYDASIAYYSTVQIGFCAQFRVSTVQMSRLEIRPIILTRNCRNLNTVFSLIVIAVYHHSISLLLLRKKRQ